MSGRSTTNKAPPKLNKEVRIHLEKVGEDGNGSSGENVASGSKSPPPEIEKCTVDEENTNTPQKKERSTRRHPSTPDSKKLISELFAKPKPKKEKAKNKKRKGGRGKRPLNFQVQIKIEPAGTPSTSAGGAGSEDDEHEEDQRKSEQVADDDDARNKTENDHHPKSIRCQKDDSNNAEEEAEGGIENEDEEHKDQMEVEQQDQEEVNESENEEMEEIDIRRRLRSRSSNIENGEGEESNDAISICSGSSRKKERTVSTEQKSKDKDREMEKPAGRQTVNSRNAAATAIVDDDIASKKSDDDDDKLINQLEWKPVRAAMVAAMELVAKKQVTEDMRLERRVRKQMVKVPPKGRGRRAMFKKMFKPIKSFEDTAGPQVTDGAYYDSTFFHKGDIVSLTKDICGKSYLDLDSHRFFQVNGILKIPLKEDCAGLILLHRVVPLPLPKPKEEQDIISFLKKKRIPGNAHVEEEDDDDEVVISDDDEQEAEGREDNDDDDTSPFTFNLLHYQPVTSMREILVPLSELKFVMRCPPDFYCGHDLLYRYPQPGKVYGRLGSDYYEYQEETVRKDGNRSGSKEENNEEGQREAEMESLSSTSEISRNNNSNYNNYTCTSTTSNKDDDDSESIASSINNPSSQSTSSGSVTNSNSNISISIPMSSS